MVADVIRNRSYESQYCQGFCDCPNAAKRLMRRRFHLKSFYTPEFFHPKKEPAILNYRLFHFHL